MHPPDDRRLTLPRHTRTSARLVLGFLDVRFQLIPRLLYDAGLGVLGTALTLSAAFDFRAAHSRVKNVASGALDDDATVTFAEMMEHAFYQGQNLVQARAIPRSGLSETLLLSLASGAHQNTRAAVLATLTGCSVSVPYPPQILYLHAVRPSVPLPIRAALCCAAASPWLLRHRFPVNRFSDNWRKGQRRSATTLMYMVKKWQYVAYKHLLLFGLNATVCLTGASVADGVPVFRLYWVALNAAYTSEFFLQTLVKRRYMRQGTMLLLNQLLMAVSSVAAAGVLGRFVSLPLSLLSLGLNFRPGGRGRDFWNAAAVLAAGALLTGQLGGSAGQLFIPSAGDGW